MISQYHYVYISESFPYSLAGRLKLNYIMFLKKQTILINN